MDSSHLIAAGALASVIALLVLTVGTDRLPPPRKPPVEPICQCGEVCDGRDNDCDGLIDEEIPDQVNGISFGSCYPEVLRCVGGRLRVIQPGRDEGCELRISTRRNGSDGTEVNEARWTDQGMAQGANVIGHEPGRYYDLGLRFPVPELKAGQRVEYARISLAATGAGEVTSGLTLRIVGLASDGVGSFRQQRPSQFPKTEAAITWRIDEDWSGPTNGERRKCMPFRRYTPDLSPIINEILSRPGWGQGDEPRSLGLVIEDRSEGGDTNMITVEDGNGRTASCRDDHAPILELYPTVRSTLLGRELLGRVTDHGVTVNAHALVPLEVGFLLGTEPQRYTQAVPARRFAAREEIEIEIDGLEPDQRYFYRLRYRRAGVGNFATSPERTFHTQRARDSSFKFVVQSDSHIIGAIAKGQRRGLAVYRQTLVNELAARPDFLLDLGDTFHTQYFAGRDAKDEREAVERHLTIRRYFDILGHSVPLFFVIGNHEGEQGWRLDGTDSNLPIWATRARKLLYPNPQPDGFYGGLGREHPHIGQRESTFAWEWGDALFVALDLFWYTEANPHPKTRGAGSQDHWRWTLGREQYDWLRETLAGSEARYKLVFIHHLAGGLDRKPYGRGGARAVKHALGGQGSFEWGGENRDGTWGFTEQRPGWPEPIHNLLVKNEVTMVVHGHDHCFAWEMVDHIAYLAVPAPSDAAAGYGFCWKRSLYGGAIQRPNSGHVEVTVRPPRLEIDYVRSRPRRPDQNGRSIFTAVLYDCNKNGIIDSKELAVGPSPDPTAAFDTLPCGPDGTVAGTRTMTAVVGSGL